MDGFFLIDKEQDWTSSDVVVKLRHILHEKKIGHAGTLDPMATGLVIVMVGKGCKKSDALMKHDKEYIAKLRLGLTTDTQDIWGNVLKEQVNNISDGDVKEAITHFVGEKEQIPPMYSAIKINGQKLYELARKGKEVERKSRLINVYSIELIGKDEDDYVLDIKCSSGTYIRTLCHDIGNHLGCGGCMSGLNRIKVGNASIENAHKIGEILDDTFLLPLDSNLVD